MRRVLVLSPHPDDEAIGCGGTLAKHVLSGDEVRAIYLTSGERGIRDMDHDQTARVREREAARAGEILGLSGQEFWRERDGELRVTRRLVERLREYLTTWPPDLLYVTHAREVHPDHRAAAALVRRTLAANGEPEVYMYEIWTPLERLDRIEDISDQLKTKLAAIRAYRSQCRAIRFDDAARGLNRYRGEMHCWRGGGYAEAFSKLAR